MAAAEHSSSTVQDVLATIDQLTSAADGALQRFGGSSSTEGLAGGTATPERVAALAQMLARVGAVKFGEFKLKSGLMSPVYFDLRVLIAYPDILQEVSDLLLATAVANGAEFDQICGVPYTALSFGTLMATRAKKPMVMRRKEAKSYGTKKLIEGVFEQGQRCLIVDDLVTSGLSVFETVEALEGAGLVTHDIVVLLDREQGGRQNIESRGKRLHAVMTVTQVLDALQATSDIDAAMASKVRAFVRENQVKVEVDADGKPLVVGQASANSSPSKRKPQATFKQRAAVCTSAIGKRLFHLMEKKKSNLCVAADVYKSEDLLRLADAVGPYVCCLKTHCDVVEDWTAEVAYALRALADAHDFLLFEDRKFADIGNTVVAQASTGYHHISNWSDFVNAHSLPGPGIVDGLKQAMKGAKCQGLLLLAEMSSAGNLCTEEYSKKTLEMAVANKDVVFGFISQKKLHSESPDPFIYMTPGVKMGEGGDNLGQQYNTPESVILDRLSDVIIVGRGIYQAADPAAAAEDYQRVAWQAYCHRCTESRTFTTV